MSPYYSDVIMSAMESHITGVSIVCLAVCSGADQRKYKSSASRTFARGIHRWLVDSPHKGPVTRKLLPYDDVIKNHPCGCLIRETILLKIRDIVYHCRIIIRATNELLRQANTTVPEDYTAGLPNNLFWQTDFGTQPRSDCFGPTRLTL